MPPAIITSSILHSLRTNQHLPPQTWYFVSGVALSILNRPDEVSKVFQHAIEEVSVTSVARQEEQLRVARRMREALVKASAVGGLPKTINALLALKNVSPPHLLDEAHGLSPSSRPVELYDMPSSQILQRGEQFFDTVYGKVAKKVMGQMDRCGTEDLGLTARLMYGYLLSNTSILSAAESSFVLIAGLVPQDVNPQLKGHLRGAVNNGATVAEVRAIRDVVIGLCEASGMKLLDDQSRDSWGWRSQVATL